jgi:hypothetical protein
MITTPITPRVLTNETGDHEAKRSGVLKFRSLGVQAFRRKINSS